MPNTKLLIIIASTRPGRVGLPVGRWFEELATAHGGFDVTTVDLQELNLPLLDEPHHPRLRDYVHDHTKRWSEIVDAAEAIVWVTPEYNHSYPATLKNAIDFLHAEWRHKPLGFVSYGGIAAGTRAVQALKPVATSVGLVSVGTLVNIAWVAQKLSNGEFEADAQLTGAANTMLDELAQLSQALAPLREPQL